MVTTMSDTYRLTRRDLEPWTNPVGLMDVRTEQVVREWMEANRLFLDSVNTVEHFTRSDGKKVTHVYAPKAIDCVAEPTQLLELSTLGVSGDTLSISLLDVVDGTPREYVTVTVPHHVTDEGVWTGSGPVQAFLDEMRVVTYQRPSSLPISTARAGVHWCDDLHRVSEYETPGIQVWPRCPETVMQMLMEWCPDDFPVVFSFDTDTRAPGITVECEGLGDLKLLVPSPALRDGGRALSWVQSGGDFEGVVPYTAAALRSVFDTWRTTASWPLVNELSSEAFYRPGGV